MEEFEKEIKSHNLQKALSSELEFDSSIESIIKGKSHPLGTKRVWGGVEYEKKPEGWMPTRSKEKVEKKEVQDPNDPVIKDPDKFKVESVREPNPHNPKNYKVDYKINGVVVCTVKKYSDSFCSIKHGVPSNIRDTTKTCYSTSWNSSGIEKVTGLSPSSDDYSRRRSGRFGGSYPDTTWGDVGGMESATGVKGKIAAFIKEKRSKNKEFTEDSPIMMKITNRTTYTSSDPKETTLKNLKEGGWDFKDEDFEKIKQGETVTHYSSNGMLKMSVSQKK